MVDLGHKEDRDSLRRHLDKIASSQAFARSDQLRRFLLWLAERQDERNPPTEKEIGLMFFRRKDFDPQVDSLVRKETSRLREKLDRFYATEGTGVPVRIALRAGYRLELAENATSADSGRTPGNPCLLVLPFRSAEPGPGLDLHDDLHALIFGLGGGLDLVSPTTSLSYLNRHGDVRVFAAECGADYLLEGSLRQQSPQAWEALVWLVDGSSGRSKQANRLSAPGIAELGLSVAAWVTAFCGKHKGG